MIVAVSIAPSGNPLDGTSGDMQSDDRESDGAGVASAVALAVKALRASGLPVETNAMFTNIEGEWDEVMAAVKSAVDVTSLRYPRVSLVLKADIRAGHTDELGGKIDRLERALDRLDGGLDG